MSKKLKARMIYLPDELLENLKRESERAGVSVSSLVKLSLLQKYSQESSKVSVKTMKTE